MGWTSYRASYYKKNGDIDRKAEMDNLFEKEFRVVKSTMIGSVYYAAVERTADDGEKIVFGFVGLTSVDRNDYFNFSYKDMDETTGPYECKCPNAILDLLTPTESEWANAWRSRCREYNAKPKLSKLPNGARIAYSYGEKKVVLEKCAPNYQFRKTWWYRRETNTYVPSRRIPDTWERVS